MMVLIMTTHVMVDIETHSTQTFAAIASIAAAVFDPNGKSITAAFYRNVQPDSCDEIGLHFDPEVAAWWERQDPQVRDALKDNQLPIRQVLSEFKDWYHNKGATHIWSQGASFDVPILANAYSMLSMKTPWNFMNVRDTRTIYDVSDFNVGLVKRGAKHEAASDVLFQVRCVQGSYAKLKIERGM
jgi:hypothetical protein